MKNVITITSALLLSVAATAVIAQTEAAAAPQGVEQIEVTGEPTVISLRQQSEQLELKMYTLYNALNSSDDFDVACGPVTPTGSKLPVWECSAAFMREAGNTNVQSTDHGTLSQQTPKALARQNRGKEQKLNEEMLALARQNPELASAMISLNNTRQQLAQLEGGKKSDRRSSGRK